jgi:hypothetical protein
VFGVRADGERAFGLGVDRQEPSRSGAAKRRANGSICQTAWHAACFPGPRERRKLLVLITLLVVLLLLALLGGGYGHSRGWGYSGWSPLGLLVLIILILALTGNLSF